MASLTQVDWSQDISSLAHLGNDAARSCKRATTRRGWQAAIGAGQMVAISSRTLRPQDVGAASTVEQGRRKREPRHSGIGSLTRAATIRNPAGGPLRPARRARYSVMHAAGSVYSVDGNCFLTVADRIAGRSTDSTSVSVQNRQQAPVRDRSCWRNLRRGPSGLVARGLQMLYGSSGTP